MDPGDSTHLYYSANKKDVEKKEKNKSKHNNNETNELNHPDKKSRLAKRPLNKIRKSDFCKNWCACAQGVINVQNYDVI